ncbi:MAG: hypothetical protein QY309_01300 [Cyclobacteriaceae bacterium]|nr:MAG: hypothetical protein QY309_01300 [Cyclobacteriaceae bacterium]
MSDLSWACPLIASAEGYGAFTCSVRSRDRIINYIKNQKEHHKKKSFIDEYKNLLTEHEIEFDERYLL